MASVVEFRRTGLHSRSLSMGIAKGPGEIVLFPGVRYERKKEETPPPANERRRARRRDRLDFED